jgi:hypothetical protein
MRGWGENFFCFWQKRSPNCNFLVLHSPSTLSTSKNMRRVGPAWGVRRAWFGWEKFSIVFTPYSIDLWGSTSQVRCDLIHKRRRPYDRWALKGEEEIIAVAHLYRVYTRWGGGPDAPLWGDICIGRLLQPVQMRSFVTGQKILDTNEKSAQRQILIL